MHRERGPCLKCARAARTERFCLGAVATIAIAAVLVFSAAVLFAPSDPPAVQPVAHPCDCGCP